MNLIGPLDGFGTCLRQAQVTHLALLNQAFHGPHSVLDGHGRIDPVQGVQIDDIHTQALERTLAGNRHVPRVSPGVPSVATASQGQVAEFGTDEGLLAPTDQCPTQQAFVGTIAVGI